MCGVLGSALGWKFVFGEELVCKSMSTERLQIIRCEKVWNISYLEACVLKAALSDLRKRKKKEKQSGQTPFYTQAPGRETSMATCLLLTVVAMFERAAKRLTNGILIHLGLSTETRHSYGFQTLIDCNVDWKRTISSCLFCNNTI